jgi:5-methylcytosine-specific restriction endonuclease McrA
MGGSKSADKPENLMALCRDCHEKYGDKRDYKNFLKGVHNERLSRRP